MNKKVISLTIAAVMVSQSLAFAEVDRTSIVTEKIISESKQNLLNLRSHLISLDERLKQMESNIRSRESDGSELNTAAVIGALIGTSLAALTLVASKVHLKEINTLVATGATLTTLSSASTMLAGIASGMQKEKVDIRSYDAELEKLEEATGAALVLEENIDSKAVVELEKLYQSIKSMRFILENYKENEKSISENRFLSSLAVGVGATLSAATLPTRS